MTAAVQSLQYGSLPGSFQKFSTVPANFRASVGASLVTSPPLIKTTASGPLLIKCDEPCSISIDVTGNPSPEVTWHVGKRRLRGDSGKYQTRVDECRHTLVVTKATGELEKGVWVRASNALGEDFCVIAIKTYKVFAGLKFSFDEPIIRQTTCAPDVVLRRAATSRSQIRRPAVSLCGAEANRSTSSVPQAVVDDWKREMVLRNRMRSVDDIQNYNDWKMADSTQSVNVGDVSRSSATRSSRRRRLVSVRRSRSDLVDPSTLGGDVSVDDHQRFLTMTTKNRSLSATGRTPRFNGNLSTTEDWRPEIQSSVPVSHAGRSSSVDGSISRHRRRGDSASRHRNHAFDHQHVPTEGEKTSKRVKSASQVNETGTGDGTGRRRRRTPERKEDVVDTVDVNVNVEVRSKRPPTGRTSQNDRTSAAHPGSSKRRSRAAKNGVMSLDDEKIVPVNRSHQLSEPSLGGTTAGQSAMNAADVEKQLKSGTHNTDEALWEMFGVRLGTLVQSLLSEEVVSEPTLLAQEMNEVDRRSQKVVPSSDSQPVTAVDSVALTLEDGSTADLDVNQHLECSESASVLYPVISLDTRCNQNGVSPVSVGDRRAPGPTKPKRDVIGEPVAMSEIDFRSSDELTLVESDTSTSRSFQNVEIVNAAEQPPTDNDAISDPSVENGVSTIHIETMELNYYEPSSDVSQMHDDVDAILSQTVDLQMILYTIDQLIAVSDADVSGSRIRRSKANFRSVDQHQPEVETASSNGREAIRSTADDGHSSTVVMRRGSILVHSDDDGDFDDDLSELDRDSFYCDATLSATSDLCAQLNVGGDTDNDSDNFDSAEYEKDVDVQDIGAVKTTESAV